MKTDLEWELTATVQIFNFSMFPYLSLFHMYDCLTCMYVSVPQMCKACLGQKKTLDSLEQELQMVMWVLVTAEYC